MRAAKEHIDYALQHLTSALKDLHTMAKRSIGTRKEEITKVRTEVAQVYESVTKARIILNLKNIPDMTVFMEMPLWAVSFKANDGKEYVTMTVAPNKTMAIQNVQRCNSDFAQLTGIDNENDVLINSDHIKTRAEKMEAEAIAENLAAQQNQETQQ